MRAPRAGSRPLGHFLGFLLRQQEEHFDAHVAFLGRPDELDLFGGGSKGGNDGDGLTGRGRLGCKD